MKKYIYTITLIIALLFSISTVTATEGINNTHDNINISDNIEPTTTTSQHQSPKIIKKENIYTKTATTKHDTNIKLKTSTNPSHIIMNATLKSDIPVNNGYVIYKLNGVTLKNSKNETIKVNIVNSQAVLTLQTQQYRRVYTSSEAVYSGSSTFEQSRNTQNNTINTRITPTIKITRNQSSYFAGQSAKIDVYLSSNQTNNFHGITLFKINGETIKNSKNEPFIINMTNNHISYNYTIPLGLNKANYTFYVATEGTRYNKVSSETLLKIVHLNTNMTSNKITIDNNNYCTVNATFNDKFKKPLIGKHYVDIYIDGKKIRINNQTRTYTLKDGKLNIKFPLGNYKTGMHTIQVALHGNNEYGAFQSTRYPLNITQKYPTKIIIDTPLKAKNASTLTLRGYVTYNDSNILKTIHKGKITFTINNQTLTSDVHNGKAVISFKLPGKIGNYPITATYTGVDDLKDSKTSKAITLTSGSISPVESSILGNKNPENERIALTNNIPNLVYMTNYVWADEDATYTLTREQYQEVTIRDSYTLYLNNFMSKYVAFKTKDEPNIYHVLRRQKWNVIEKDINLNLVLSNGGTYPEEITSNLKSVEYTYSEVRDHQNTSYTCGPTSLSMCSQVLKTYTSEKRLAIDANTDPNSGSSTRGLANGAKCHNMSATFYYNTTFDNALNQLAKGGCALIFHTWHHYVAILDISSDKKKVLVGNPSGNYNEGSHGIPTNWLTVDYMKKCFNNYETSGLILKLNYNLTDTTKDKINNMYNNFGVNYIKSNVAERIPNTDD